MDTIFVVYHNYEVCDRDAYDYWIESHLVYAGTKEACEAYVAANDREPDFVECNAETIGEDGKAHLLYMQEVPFHTSYYCEK